MGLAEKFSGDVLAENGEHAKHSRMPILWIFVPQFVAYVLCELGFSFPEKVFPWTLGIAFFCASTALASALFSKFRGNAISRDIWKIFLPVAVLFLAGTWWSANAAKLLEWGTQPETESELVLKVDSLFRSRGKSWTGLADVESSSFAGTKLAGTRVYFQFSKKETKEIPYEGMRFKMRGVLKGVANDHFFDGDFRDFLLSKNAGVAVVLGDNVEVFNAGKVGIFAEWCVEQRREIIKRLVVPGSRFESESRILAAMLFGEYDLLFQDQLNDFRVTGTLHIFAISGMHVAILAIALFAVFSLARFPFLVNAVVTLCALWIYISVAGTAPSSVRAWTMIALMFVAQVLRRRSSPLAALFWAGTGMLWLDPSLLSNLGFQLSYGVVAAILLYGSPLEKFILNRWVLFRFIPEGSLSFPRRALVYLHGKIIGLAAISFSSFLAGTCFLVTHFEIVTPFSVFVNVLLVPFCGILLCLAFVAAVLCRLPVLDFFADFIWAVDCRITSVVETVSAICADVPATVEIRFIPEWVGTLGGVLMLIFFAFGDFSPLRSRPALRFAFPPLFLLAYLLAFAR